MELLIFNYLKMDFLKKLFNTIFLTNIGRMSFLFVLMIACNMIASNMEDGTFSNVLYYISAFSFIALMVYVLIGIFFAIKNTISDFKKPKS